MRHRASSGWDQRRQGGDGQSGDGHSSETESELKPENSNIEVAQEEGYVDMTSLETKTQVGLTIMAKVEDHIYVNDGWEEKGTEQGTQCQEDAVLYPGIAGWLGSGANVTSTESSERTLVTGAEQFQVETRIKVKAEVHKPSKERESLSEVIDVSTEEEEDDLSYR